MSQQESPRIISVYKEIDIVAKEFRLNFSAADDEGGDGCRVIESDDGYVLAVCGDERGVVMSNDCPNIRVRTVDPKVFCHVEAVLPKQFRYAEEVKVNLKSKNAL